MKKFLFYITLLSNFAYSQTLVSGGIYQNTVWNQTGSPYIVTGSVVVFPGNTLTIEPGVTILISNVNSNEIYIETRGTLNMIGNDQFPITIRTEFDTTNIGWQGFKCTSSQGGTLNADRFRISNAQIPFDFESILPIYQYTNCWFSHCGQAVTVGNEIILDNCQFYGNETAIYGWSYFTLNNCIFKDNQFAINAYSTSFNLSNSTFNGNTNAVVFSSSVFDTMLIQNCTFQNNVTAVSGANNGMIKDCNFLNNIVGVQGSYACEIKNNTFNYNELALNVSVLTNLIENQINENTVGVQISDITSDLNAPIIMNNEICGNFNFNVDNNTNVNYSLLTNCFCGLDSNAIEEFIFDGYDDITKGLISYQEFDSTCSTILNTVMKFNVTANVQSKSTEKLKFSNPISSYLEFFVSDEIHEIELIDVASNKIKLLSVGRNRFDVSDLNSGFYILQTANQKPINQNIIKM
jgi:hypothetical protein